MSMQEKGQHSGALYFLSVRGLKKGQSVTIKRYKPNPDPNAPQDQKYLELPDIDSVSGQLVKAEVEMREWDGKMMEELKLTLNDSVENETYILKCGLNRIGRAIINNLASIEDDKIGEIKIAVYTSRNTGSPSVYMEHNGQKLSWKFQKEELEKYVKVTKKRVKGADGKMTTVEEADLLDLNEMLINVYKEIAASKVSGRLPQEAKSVKKEAVAAAEDDGGDDLPF